MEVFIEPLQKWFDVRARYLQWTDGRLAQMLWIATDINAPPEAPKRLAAPGQAENAQVTSRLVTMGEMASSVAHELNQPLTAITNYCNGIITRVNNNVGNAIEKPDLIAALEKTAKQAERAGQIIHRIRNFVKRSEPQRQAAQAYDIVEDAVELAGIELRRRNVAIHTYVAQRLPVLLVDPILIEQVVLNLLKNSAEAIDNAKMPPARRASIELRVVPRHTRRRRRRDRVQRDRHRPGFEGRSHRPFVRSLLLDQGRRPGHWPQPVPLHHREPPGSDQSAELIQWRPRCRLPFYLSRCRSKVLPQVFLPPQPKATVTS